MTSNPDVTRRTADSPGSGGLAGRTAVVTGGSGGIGSAIVRALARQGVTVAVADTDEQAEALACEVGGFAVVGDLTDPEMPGRLVDQVTERTGSLDILVNAAGIQVRTAAVDISAEDWDRLVSINLTAAYRLVQAAAKPLAAIGGSIVNIVSLSADRAVPGIVPYGATKAALLQLTKGLAVELGPSGIRVNAVAPGYVTTAMTAAVLDQPDFRERVLTRVPLGRLADGGDIADVVAFLASDAARYMTGTVLPVDGGYSIT
ncbi:SDR family oxidoreductase [Streptomyces sp. TG1A-8]|uniref:SDR family NAD(P)-dependent oxidoreductase n=1 Tax=Streptomyces sp. TG1A-8 TaxID=3051385 RepID=UPI00265C2B26|nr:SDR family oxidoreductase [Streptomyces sp. TG1A-8]MDO0929591.1 SDR family oxidoreductase [Streptomyces sp. TG1A-8]